MTTIVKHRKTGNEYILLGVNKAGGKINLPSRFLNDLFTQEESENSTSVTVCDARGNIFLAYIEDLIVIEIDGKKPSEILPELVNPNIDRDFEEEDFDDDDFNSGGQQTSPTTPTVDTGSEFKSNDDEFEEEEEWI